MSRRKNENLRIFYAYPAHRSASSRLVVAVNKEEKVENFPASNSHAPAEDPTHSIFFSVARRPLRTEQNPNPT
jgi:hypothetical protein